MGKAFVGRTGELEHVLELLDEWRLVTIVGPGGAGKTRLAEEVVKQLDGVTETHFVALGAHTAERLAETTAAELGVPSLNVFCRTNGDRSAVIVLDNCEHVLDEVADIASNILDDCPSLAVLATSREPLELEDERIVPLVGLETEHDDSPSPAAEMYITEIAARGIDHQPPLVEVERLVKQLDGLPLAIELAAAKARSTTPAEMLRDLEPRIDLLARRRDRGPARHRSLRAAIRWSYEQLTADEQSFLTNCSLFEGLFTTGMAATINAVDEAHATATLTDLVERSLVHTQLIGSVTWYRLLVTIRTFCRDELRQRDMFDDATERLVEAAIRVVEERPFAHLSIGYEDGAVRATAAFDTVRKAVRWCLGNDDTPTRAYRILRWVWWLDAGGYQAEGANLCDLVFARWDDPSDPGWPLAAASAATLYRDVARREEARTIAEKVLALDDAVAHSLAHRVLGLMERAVRNFEDARQHFAAAIAIAEEHDLAALRDELRVHQALVEVGLGNGDEALALSSDVARRTADQPSSPNHIWAELVNGYLRAPDDPLTAAETLDAVAPHARSSGSTWAICSVAAVRGVIHAIAGEWAQAGHELARSVDGFYRAGNRPEVSWACRGAMVTLAKTGHPDEAALAGGISALTTPTHVLSDHDLRLLSRVGPIPDPAEVVDLASAVRIVCRTLETLEPAPTSRQRAGIFQHTGDTWTIGLGDGQHTVRNSKGMHDLHHLLRRPNVPIDALDLMDAKVVSGSLGEASDDEALAQYRRKLVELEEQISDAEEIGDDLGAERFRTERDTLITHIASAYGLRGAPRIGGDPAEKARSAVTWRLRAAMRNIRAVDAGLFAHLDRSIQTGRQCVYTPSDTIEWRL